MYNFKINDSLKPGLYCVSTPIGNLGDITFRAIYILNKSDLILSEDTRVSSKLLSRFNINTKLLSNHKFNEKKNVKNILNLFNNFFETLVSSHKIKSEFFIISIALSVISPRFPIGVETQYSPGFKLLIFLARCIICEIILLNQK